MRCSDQVAAEIDGCGDDDDAGGSADDGGGGGGDGANDAPGTDPGVAGSLERTLKPPVERFRYPFSLGWCYRSCSACGEFGLSFCDVLWGCEPCGVNSPSKSTVGVQERVTDMLDRRNCYRCYPVFCRDTR